MASGAIPSGDNRDMGTASLAGRNALDIAVIRSLSQRSDLQGLLRMAAHLGVMLTTGYLVYRAQSHWYLLIPAMIAHGFTLVTMFAPMHECVHRTAFDSKWMNETFGWVAGLLSFYNFTYYRLYHTWHHRYTQDAERDPELMTPKPRTMWEYFVEISGLSFWLYRPLLFFKMATGQTQAWAFVPDSARKRIAISASAQLAVYVAAIISIAMGYKFALYEFFLPAILAQPLLRAILITEHTGCSHDENGLTNTRTTLASFPIRLLMWNMPFHTEHHLYPSIPFHHLPEAHRELKTQLAHLAPDYISTNCEIVKSLGSIKSEPVQ